MAYVVANEMKGCVFLSEILVELYTRERSSGVIDTRFSNPWNGCRSYACAAALLCHCHGFYSETSRLSSASLVFQLIRFSCCYSLPRSQHSVVTARATQTSLESDLHLALHAALSLAASLIPSRQRHMRSYATAPSNNRERPHSTCIGALKL